MYRHIPILNESKISLLTAVVNIAKGVPKMQLHFGAKRTGCVPGGECVAAMGGATFETADLPLCKFAKLIARKH